MIDNTRITALALAVFAAICALPSLASATNDPEVTHPTGTLVPAGTTFLATNVGNTVTTDTNGTVLTECASLRMTGTLTKNNGTEVEGNITSVTLSGTGPSMVCTSTIGTVSYTFAGITNGLPWCIRSTGAMTTDEVQIRGNECSKAARPIRVLIHTSIGECAYERSSPIIGTYTTDTSGQDASIQLSKQLLTGVSTNGFLCTPEVLYDLTVTLETDTTSSDPLYVS